MRRSDLSCRTAANQPAEPAPRADSSALSKRGRDPDAALSGSGGAGAAASSTASAITVLKGAQPVDRLRYQALLLFDHFDADKDGVLAASELQAFHTYSGRKLMWSPGLSEALQGVQAAVDAELGGGPCSRHRFLQLVRDQVHAVSCSVEFQRGGMRPDDAARLQAQMGLTLQEICAAKWVFTLLDYDADGKLQLSDLEKATGIEEYYFEAQLQDSDNDEDGALVFEEFLLSYAKPRPVWKNLVIMAANTLVIFAVFQSPLDIMLKCILVGALVLRPQIISRTASLFYDAVAALVGSSRVKLQMGGGGGSGGTGGRGSIWRAA